MPLSIEILRERLHSKNWETARETAAQLGALASQETYQVLIEALASESALTRNSAALTIGDLRLQAAVPALLEAILKPANVNHRGTLVYALTAMDCSHLFSFLFRLALEANYECRISALGVLLERGFYVSDDELDEAQALLSHSINTSICAEDAPLFSDLSEVLKNLRKTAVATCPYTPSNFGT